MKVHQHKPYNFPSFNLDKLFLTCLTIDPSVPIIEDELWYLWCLIVLYATKIVFPVQYVLRHLFDPSQASSILWTLFEWFSPLSWWHKHLNILPKSEGDLYTTVFIVHRPYFQHPVTKLFWTQDQAYEWIIVPHPFPLSHDPQLVNNLRSFLLELNHVQPPSPEHSTYLSWTKT